MGSFRPPSTTAQGLGSPSSSQSSDMSSSVPPSPKPRFADAVVSTISRPLNLEEHWALYYFESHARACKRCHNPYAVLKEGGRLCSEGQHLGEALSHHLARARDGHVRSARREKVDGGYADVWVEIPRGFKNALGYLKAVERSARHEKLAAAAAKAPKKDKYAVQEPVIHHYPKTTTTAKPYHTVTAEPHIVSWPRRDRSLSPTPETKAYHRGSLYEADVRARQERERTEQADEAVAVVAGPVVHPGNRGSLYEAELRSREERERRERQLPYRVELREPRPGRQYHRHSVFWG